MGKQIILSLLLIFLIFFLPWLWGGPAAGAPPVPDPPPAVDEPQDLPPAGEPDSPRCA